MKVLANASNPLTITASMGVSSNLIPLRIDNSDHNFIVMKAFKAGRRIPILKLTLGMIQIDVNHGNAPPCQ